MTDIVIDCNVFSHALNPGNEFFETALNLVRSMEANDVELALDDTGKNQPALETSSLYKEYADTLPPGSLSRNILQRLSDAGRVKFLLRPERQQWRQCEILVPKNVHDRIVLGIGVASDDHLIASNDYDDFPSNTRRAARKKLGVTILDSDEIDA